VSHFAQIDENNIVTQVLVGDNTLPDEGYNWFVENLGGTWVKTSYNTHGGVHTLGGTPLHKNYAGIGFTFDGVGFAAPKPFDSWTLDTETYIWNAPTPMPTDDKYYQWDELTLSWVELVLPTE
jgi:hypothetical protein